MNRSIFLSICILLSLSSLLSLALLCLLRRLFCYLFNGSRRGVCYDAIELCYNHIGRDCAVKLGYDAVANNLEVGHILLGDRLGRLLWHLERVDGCAILPDAVVEVWTCRCTCRTHIPAELSLRYSASHLDAGLSDCLGQTDLRSEEK
mgnify:CR=1 FL=1